MKGVLLGAGSAVAIVAFVAACSDLSGFNTSGGSYQGSVVDAPFVLAGIDGGSTTLCLTLDTNHLQDTPGNLSTSDGRFHAVAMRSIPQFWQDPLSTLQFGEGRVKNMMYMVRASTPYSDGDGNDVLAVVSLMHSGDVEVRLIRGAPDYTADGGTISTMQNVFGIFDLQKQSTPCSY
jgi:hypothetical protein